MKAKKAGAPTPAQAHGISYLTYDVAAAAYSPQMWKKIDRGAAKCLTHAVNVATNAPVCGKVLRKHLLDDSGLITNQPPTCQACLKALGLPPR